jgi:hypothetical protein
MFTITSNPFAETTQGLSGLPRSSSSSLSLQSPQIQPDYSYYHKPPKESSCGLWKIILGIVAVFSTIGVCLWFSDRNKEKAKKEAEEEQRKLEEEEKKKVLPQ